MVLYLVVSGICFFCLQSLVFLEVYQSLDKKNPFCERKKRQMRDYVEVRNMLLHCKTDLMLISV